MSIKSTSVALTTAAVAVPTRDDNANRILKVALIPDAAILIGGPDAQTFPVSTSGITIDLLAGDTLYAKTATGTATVQVLQVGF